MRQYLEEIIKRKDLLFYLVKSGLKAENRDSYLGYFWWLLDPLLNVLVYYFLVVVILGRGDSENYAVFLVIGLVVWRWINTTIKTSSKAITKYSSIINQVYLPKSIFPIALSTSQLFNFIFGLVVIAIFLTFFGIVPGWQIIYLPLIILITLIALLALGMLIAYICVFVRDIDYILTHIMRIFFYASPIIWEGGRLQNADIVQSHDFIMTLAVTVNPVAIILEAFRDVLMRQQIPDFWGLFIMTIVSLVMIVVLLYHYKRNEHKIIKAL
ncbi:ABC transporter [Gracilibacillus halophilus YIM-C55.5]|uniref:Transport permease protein n=1 Tax=Gracilibacillus halophilus YIM-C55.5 TaxID=1308866 RepID=N4WQ62_9BACI|nr:ABC transporter permease [Gracilibacillus halophilus]ENH96580.1 ABC transporter [Gracilibacillus halophilus YIM-C55.5]